GIVISVLSIDAPAQRARIRIQLSGLNPVWLAPSPIQGAGAQHWSRGPDLFVAADVDGDGHDEFLIADNQNGWTGVLKWNGAALVPIWLVPSPVQGAGVTWIRGPDLFVAADVDGDGHDEFL